MVGLQPEKRECYPELFRTCERPRQRLDELADFIPYPPIDRQLLLPVRQMLGQLRRIFKPNVNHLGLAGKDGTVLVGMAAHGHDIIELNRADFCGRF